MPISPFSYRGVALPFTDFMGIQTGGSLYRMPGLNIGGLPFKSEKPMYGPNMTVYVPLELYVQLGNRNATLSLKGGVFAFYSLFAKLNLGNIDRAIAGFEGWDVANASFDYQKKPGWGYQGGVEFLVNVSRQFGLTFEVNYLTGSSRLSMDGGYSGGTTTIQVVTASYPDSYVDLTGVEVSVGVIFGQ